MRHLWPMLTVISNWPALVQHIEISSTGTWTSYRVVSDFPLELYLLFMIEILWWLSYNTAVVLHLKTVFSVPFMSQCLTCHITTHMSCFEVLELLVSLFYPWKWHLWQVGVGIGWPWFSTVGRWFVCIHLYKYGVTFFHIS